MTAELTRSQLLRGGVRGGATLLVAGSALGALAGSAQAAPPSGAVGPLAAADLASTRLLIGVELLLIDFYTNAIASRHLRADAEADARLALINEAEHYDYLSFVLTSAGLVALTSADVDFTYPAGAYYTADSVTALAVTRPKHFVLVRDAGPRPDQAHLAPEHIDKLGQFVHPE